MLSHDRAQTKIGDFLHSDGWFSQAQSQLLLSTYSVLTQKGCTVQLQCLNSYEGASYKLVVCGA